MGSMICASPFQLFPKEIWEMIFDNVENSKDILVILRSYPELDLSSDKRKRFWFLDQILPFLSQVISKTDLSNLSLVCKQWQRRAKSFIQNQERFKVHSKDQESARPLSLKYSSKCMEFYEGGSYNAEEKNSPHYVVKKLLKYPTIEQAPLFRELTVEIASRNANNLFDIFTEFARKLWKGLERKRQIEIWHLNVCLGVSRKTGVVNGLKHFLIQMLHFLPNLRSINISEKGSNCDVADILKVFLSYFREHVPNGANLLKRDLPQLPFLDTLRICTDLDTNDNFLSQMLKKYAPQIKRLVVSFDRMDMKGRKLKLFPFLTELKLTETIPNQMSLSTLDSLLSSISPAHLVKLQIVLSKNKKVFRLSFEDDILKWLKRFPHLKYFQISSTYGNDQIEIEECGTADPKVDIFPSLQCLKLIDCPSLSYNFLRCFPSLNYLEIKFGHFSDNPVVVDLSMPNSYVKLREQIQTGRIYESNVWQLLPKLRTICLKYKRRSLHVEFQRYIFEGLMKSGEIRKVPKMRRFRPDILEFLKPSITSSCIITRMLGYR